MGADLDGPAQATDGAEAIEFDPLGNVYVTGYSLGSNTSYDCATIKYNSGGAEQWVKRYDASGTWDRAYALAMDDSANVYITGVSAKNPGQDGDYLTIKYSTEGSTRWIRRFDGVGSTHDEAMDIAVDGLGNAYVTGWNSKENLAKDVTTVKYDAAGKLGWAARYPGLGNTYDTAHSIAVDDSGNVYIAGTSEGYAWSVFTTIKYGQKPLSVSDGEIHQPDRFHLEPNYPNPFNGKTAISFQISAFSPVELTIHNIRGQKVATLMNDTKSAGTYRVFWDGTDESGQPLASGIYIYRLKTDHQLASIKMLLLR